MNRDDFPDHIEAQLKIVMCSDIPKAMDSPPANLRMPLLERPRQLSSGLGERFQTPKYGIPSVEIVGELLES
ncbi:MAG TPA: hypothetical protein VK821_06285 [Dehalococcoidia bacterium]|nr:hypothetical protein [Dehalococcoidia bacterium]